MAKWAPSTTTGGETERDRGTERKRGALESERNMEKGKRMRDHVMESVLGRGRRCASVSYDESERTM